jgi:hypothetical protein
MLKQIGSARAARVIWINRERRALPALPLTYSRLITYGRARFWAFESFREDATLFWTSSTRSDVCARKIRVDEADEAFTSCQLGLDQPSSKSHRSICT